MAEIVSLARFTVPLGQQEIEVQQIEHVEGGMPLMRLRIREGKRFTIFDIDPVTAGALGAVLQQWASDKGPQP
ncbi:MAG: hypothetical protein KGI47_10360 [Betaproteobacteria bacterium]|nr:hypothetical protein [Betaproteobacteria bacterium]MDE2623412.1 hypothetical protein [Betaproteobacteria bacterium]